jgi:hypothetical protein
MCDITFTAEAVSLHKILVLSKIPKFSNSRVGLCYKLKFLTVCKLDLTGESEDAGGIIRTLF